MTNLSKKNLLKILQLLADGHYDLSQLIGDLATLTTSDKTSLVAALNEIKTAVGNAGLKEAEVRALINERVNALLDGAPEAFDTLKEISDKLASGDTALEALLAKVGALQTKDTELERRLGALENSIPDDWLPDIQQRMNTGAGTIANE